jgi:hypothetical protein
MLAPKRGKRVFVSYGMSQNYFTATEFFKVNDRTTKVLVRRFIWYTEVILPSLKWGDLWKDSAGTYNSLSEDTIQPFELRDGGKSQKNHA